MSTTWHLVTGEYPPASGGVGDYTHAVACELASRGHQVHVWCPSIHSSGSDGIIHLHGLPDRFGNRSRQVLEQEWRAAPGTVLLQYVPNALGAHGMNVSFCWWLHTMGRRMDVRVMFHEPYFYFSWSPAGNARAAAQRLMAMLLVRASRVVYLSTKTWERYLRPLAPASTRTIVLTVPSTIPRACSGETVAQWRARFSPSGGIEVVGHFGTYGEHVGRELERVVPLLLDSRPAAHFVCIGRGGEPFAARLRDRHARVSSRIHATGALPPSDLAAVLRACDVVVQPYPDGITTRRTSVMASLANAVPTVSTTGALTERIWTDSHAVALAPAADPRMVAAAVVDLLQDATARRALGEAGRRMYDAHFAIDKTVDALVLPL